MDSQLWLKGINSLWNIVWKLDTCGWKGFNSRDDSGIFSTAVTIHWSIFCTSETISKLQDNPLNLMFETCSERNTYPPSSEKKNNPTPLKSFASLSITEQFSNTLVLVSVVVQMWNYSLNTNPMCLQSCWEGWRWVCAGPGAQLGLCQQSRISTKSHPFYRAVFAPLSGYLVE